MKLIESKDTDGLIDSYLSGKFLSADSDSWYLFRYPDLNEVYIGEGTCTEGLHPGFVLAPFDFTEYPQALISICAKNPDVNMIPARRIARMDIPDESTHRDVYDKEIAGIIKTLQKQGAGKTIAARAIVGNFVPDFKFLFSEMLARYRNAFVFFMSYACNGFCFRSHTRIAP